MASLFSTVAVKIFSSFTELLSGFDVQKSSGNILSSECLEVGSDICRVKAHVQIFTSITCFNVSYVSWNVYYF